MLAAERVLEGFMCKGFKAWGTRREERGGEKRKAPNIGIAAAGRRPPAGR